MTLIKIAPYGTWPSPISIEAVVRGTRALAAPRVNRASGRAFFIESTPDGRQTIIQVEQDRLKDVLPSEFSVRNRVYEYGGSKYDVLPDNRLIFSNSDDTVRLLDPDTGHVSLVIQSHVFRYSSFCASHAYPWVIAIEEDHTFTDPYEVLNTIVAINIQTSSVKRIITGADFYYSPQFSQDGSRISWVQWNHPKLPFDAGKLWVADFAADASVSKARLVAGRDGESVAEPRWGPDGSLFFGKEMGSHRKIYRIRPGTDVEDLIDLPGLDDAEFGEVMLSEGSRTYAPLTADSLVAMATINGVGRLIAIDINKGSWKHLLDPEHLCHVSGDAMAGLGDTSVLVIGGGTLSRRAVYSVDLASPGRSKVLRSETDEKFPTRLFSRPETLKFRSRGNPSRSIHGFLWMPRNPGYAAPHGHVPPLIINVHGGPTGRVGSGLNLRTQFFTSRGFALLVLNYSGSTGYGRQYRESLFGNWGVLDADDVVECADHLSGAGQVRADAIGITGASAGGYNTLQSLSRYPGKLAGGVCVAGISDLKSLDEGTHKLESDYVPALVFRPDASAKEKARILRERSALYHAQSIHSPLLLLHGEADTVVPFAQARIMAETLGRLDRDVKLVAIKDEGHMFSKPSSQQVWLEEEEKWWQKTLLRPYQ